MRPKLAVMWGLPLSDKSEAEWVRAGGGGSSTVAYIDCHINCARCIVSASQWVIRGHWCDVKRRGRAVPEEPDRALFASQSKTQRVPLMLNYCTVHKRNVRLEYAWDETFLFVFDLKSD